MNSLRKYPYCIPEKVIKKLYESFQWNSFNKRLILEYEINNTDSFKKFDFNYLLNKIRENSNELKDLNNDSKLRLFAV